MGKIAVKLTLFVLLVALIPLAIFGLFAIGTARKTSVAGIVDGNVRVAEQLSGRIEQYLENATLILKSLGQNLLLPQLNDEALHKILRNYSLAFDEFHLLRWVGRDGHVVMTSELAGKSAKDYAEDPLFKSALSGKTALSDVFMTEHLIPAVTIYMPLTRLGQIQSVLVAEIDLLHLWDLVEGMKVGERGYLNLLTRDGRYFASGSGMNKALAVQMKPYEDFGRVRPGSHFERDENGEMLLVVSSQMRHPYEWTVTVEQPVAEAYALPVAMEWRLGVIIIVLVIVLSLVALAFSRREFLGPISRLMARIRDISRGQIAGRVEITGQGEFAQLAATLNEMSEDMIRYQQELVRKENQALLGRIASSIAHDLKHPVTSIENYVRLLQIKYDDPAYRKSFSETVSREFTRVQVFLNNLKDLAREIPHTPVRARPLHILRDVVTSFSPQLEARKVVVDVQADEELWCRLDVFSMQRVLSNLVANAIEAMPGGGRLGLAVGKDGCDREGRIIAMALIEITDTGIGIAPERLPRLFDELITTKKTGLGLGLAIAHKIVSQHNGNISVKSDLGEGTRFRIHLPLAD